MAIIEKIGFDTADAIANLTALHSSLTSVNSAIAQLNRTAGNTSGLNNGAAAAQRLTLSWQTFGRVVLTQGIVRGINATLDALGEAANRAGEFEIATARIANITDEGAAGVDQLREAMRGLAVETGRSLEEISEAGLEALQNDLGTTQETMELLAGAADDLSKATGSTLTSSINSLSSIFKSYNLDISEAADVADILFTAYDKGRITLEELESRLGTITPQAASLGISFEEAASAAASLTLSGLNAATALTQYRNVQAKLIKPTEDLKAAFERLGVSTGNELIEKFGGLRGALQALRGAFGNNEQAVAKAFGTIRGQLGVLNLLANESTNFTTVLSAMDSRLGSVAAAAKEVNETTTQQISQEYAKLEDSLLGVGFTIQQLKLDTLIYVNDFVRGMQIIMQRDDFRALAGFAKEFGTVMGEVLIEVSGGVSRLVDFIATNAKRGADLLRRFLNPTGVTEDKRIETLNTDMERLKNTAINTARTIDTEFSERAAIGQKLGLGQAFQEMVSLEQAARRYGATARAEFLAAEARIRANTDAAAGFRRTLEAKLAPTLFGDPERLARTRGELLAISDQLISIQNRSATASETERAQLREEFDLQRQKVEEKSRELGIDNKAIQPLLGQLQATRQIVISQEQKALKEKETQQATEVANQALLRQEEIAKDAGFAVSEIGNAATDAGGKIAAMPNPSVNASAAIAQMKALEQAALAAARAVAAAGGGGGAVPAYFGGRMKYKAAGGPTRGADTVPAMLAPGEFVVNRNSAGKFFSQLQAMNSGQSPSFREEGGVVNNFGDISVNVSGGSIPDQTARQIASGLRREIRRQTSRI